MPWSRPSRQIVEVMFCSRVWGWDGKFGECFEVWGILTPRLIRIHDNNGRRTKIHLRELIFASSVGRNERQQLDENT